MVLNALPCMPRVPYKDRGASLGPQDHIPKSSTRGTNLKPSTLSQGTALKPLESSSRVSACQGGTSLSVPKRGKCDSSLESAACPLTSWCGLGLREIEFRLYGVKGKGLRVGAPHRTSELG